jgi:hypothetical protein
VLADLTQEDTVLLSSHLQDGLESKNNTTRLFVDLTQEDTVFLSSHPQDGLESKNNKTRVVCADELAALIERNGPSLYRPAGVDIYICMGHTRTHAHTHTHAITKTHTQIQSSQITLKKHNMHILDTMVFTTNAGKTTGAGADNLLLALVKLVGERDQAQRSAALSSLEAVYKIEGQGACVCVPLLHVYLRLRLSVRALVRV